VPLVRYFLLVGGMLLALLLVTGWYLPTPPPMSDYGAPIDEATLHVRFEHKWPQRLQFDTTTHAILPPAPPIVAAMPTEGPKLSALAEERSPETQVMEKQVTAKPKSHVVTRSRRRAPTEVTQFAVNPAPSPWTLNWQQRSWY
jgi:hypothetical protein